MIKFLHLQELAGSKPLARVRNADRNMAPPDVNCTSLLSITIQYSISNGEVSSRCWANKTIPGLVNAEIVVDQMESGVHTLMIIMYPLISGHQELR